MNSQINFLLRIMVSLWLAISFSSGAVAASDIYTIKIRGTINPATSHYLTRSLTEAQSAGAHFLLVELDTPGGLVTSVREMAQTIEQSKIPVIVYTNPAGSAATSAGALLMISSHVAAMAPGTNIGAAHPVGAQGEDLKGAGAEKAVSDISAFARSMAELRKRNVQAASEVVSKSKSYTAEEALKENLINIIAADYPALWKGIDGLKVQVNTSQTTINTKEAPVLHSIEMTPGEKILNYLSHPNIAALLMTLAIILIYSELSTPGIGIGGILGGLCLLVGFIAFQAIPIQMGGIVLLGLGALFIILEVFTATGGIMAFGGSIFVVLGLIWVVDPAMTDLRISPWLIFFIGAFLFSVTLIIGFVVSRIKKQSEEALRKMGGGDVAGVAGYSGRILEVAADGLSGQVSIRGERWNFISEDPVAENDQVKVKKVNGLTLEIFREKE